MEQRTLYDYACPSCRERHPRLVDWLTDAVEGGKDLADHVDGETDVMLSPIEEDDAPDSIFWRNGWWHGEFEPIVIANAVGAWRVGDPCALAGRGKPTSSRPPLRSIA